MLIGNRRYNRYLWLRPKEEVLILAFLQGAVYAWCDQHGNSSFAARDFVGEDNREWEGTVLMPLFNHYQALHPNKERQYAIKQAGRALGHLLKRVIVEDKRHFTTDIEEQVRHYQWDTQTEDEKNHTPRWQRAFLERLGA